MPKSKRNKQVDLCKAKKHGQEGKKKLYEEVRSCVESYAHVFIFSVNDMRNSKIKSVREQWRHSRFFIGKNKVMAIALGLNSASEFRQNLHKIGERLKGERGLLFSNKSVEEVLKWFSSYSEGDFARSGNRATETIILKEGPLSQFPHNLEPYLRQLGLPTTLKKGVVHLIQDHTVCNVGDVLTPETAKIVKLLGYEMAEFFIKIECVWSQDGSFVDLSSGEEYKENIISLNVSASNEKEKMIDDGQTMEVDDSINVENNEIEKAKPKSVERAWLVEDMNKNVNIVEDKNEIAFEIVDVDDEEESEDSDDESIPDLVEVDKCLEESKDISEVHNEKVLIEEMTVSESIKNKSEIVDASESINEAKTGEKSLSLDLVEDLKIKEVKDLIEEVAVKNDVVSENSLDINIVESKENEISAGITKLPSTQSSLDLNVMQSPLLTEKKPKFSPRVTRSVKKAKKPTKKLMEDEKESEVSIIEKSEVQTDEITEQDIKQKKRAHKRRSTGESPVERKLRNRSIKIVKNKK